MKYLKILIFSEISSAFAGDARLTGLLVSALATRFRGVLINKAITLRTDLIGQRVSVCEGGHAISHSVSMEP